VYVLQGHPTLHTDEGRTRLSPGMCAGFKAGSGNGHRLVNETSETVVYLEVGDRSLGDEVVYPDDDLKAVLLDGQWTFQHRTERRTEFPVNPEIIIKISHCTFHLQCKLSPKEQRP